MISNHSDPCVSKPPVGAPFKAVLPVIPLPGMDSWAKAAADCGFALEDVFNEVGIQLEGQSSVGPLVSTETFLKALAACSARAQSHHFPLALGDAFVFDRFQQLDAFLLTSASLRQAIEVFPLLRAFQLPWLAISLEETDQEAALVISVDPELARRAESIYLVDLVLAAARKFARAILGASRDSFSPSLVAVQLQRARPNNAVLFQDHFSAPIRFGSLRNALVFPRAMLDVPLAGSIPAVHVEARQAIQQALQSGQSPFACVEVVRLTLDSHPELLRGSLFDVAKVLGIHGRTLQRRLQAEGARFADLQAQAKYVRARQLLVKRALGLESISTELGFSDRRAFTFAFKRWAGHSPSVYRQQVTQSQSQSHT